MTSRWPYWCSKTMKRRPCWCPKPVLWELNTFLVQTLSFVPINLHTCWPREWQHSISLERMDYVMMDSNLSWKYHISHVESKINSNIGVIARLRHFTPFITLLNIFRSLIFPYISYGLRAWGPGSQNTLHSRTSTNSHLSTMATFFCPQDGRCREV